MPAWLNNPGLFLILSGFVLPLLPARGRSVLLLGAPVAGLIWLWHLPMPSEATLTLLEHTLVPMRLDPLSFVFALIFHVAAFLVGLFLMGERARLEPAAALIYAGGAIAAVLAGDLISLFLFWEITAIASALVIITGGRPGAVGVAWRYLIIQVSSGLFLMGGAAIYMHHTGGIRFEGMSLDTPGVPLIFLAFAIKAAFPLLHNWLQDCYPAASATGTVVLSAFTTKMAIYALARGFAGTDILVPIGAVMTLFPIVYALLENDLRRVLAYSLNVQLGFMVVGVGIGTELALNGTAAHAVTHVLYKALLFMAMGAVLRQAGDVRATELGGLYRQMPWTAAFCVIGAASICALPLMAGFVSKSLILGAVGKAGWPGIWLTLTIASAAALLYVGIKIPYFAFFAPDRGIRCQEAPPNMLLAMGLTAALCVLLGVYPQLLYSVLPFPVDYHPYGIGHVVGQSQLLAFAALTFLLLWRTGLYPLPLRATHLDFDWTYRYLLPRLIETGRRHGGQALAEVGALGREAQRRGLDLAARAYGDHGWLARTWGTSGMVAWATVLLAAYLVLYYW